MAQLKPQFQPQLRDTSGRQIRKLRVSLLDACNFRCFYCMPIDVKFMSPKKYLSPERLEGLCKKMVHSGVTQIRITGGEPTLRREFRDIVSRLSKLPLEKLGMTSNGFHLEKHLDFLATTNCQHINMSLDSLQEDKFNKLVRFEGFKQVFSSILKAKKMGFKIKLNTVLLKGINDEEVGDFIAFSAHHDIEVRFLELMKIGQVHSTQSKYFISATEVLNKIRKTEKLIPQMTDFDSTSYNFQTEKGAKIGFIASETQPFCSSCSRLRLTADGQLRACLMSEQGVNLSQISEPDFDKNHQQVLHDVIEMKPQTRIDHIKQDMHQIGG